MVGGILCWNKEPCQQEAHHPHQFEAGDTVVAKIGSKKGKVIELPQSVVESRARGKEG